MTPEVANRALRKLIKGTVPAVLFTGTVNAVDTTKYTCDVLPDDGGAEFFDVRLKVAINTDDLGAFSIPKKGSRVLVAMIGREENNLAVISVETVQEHIVRADGNAEVRVKQGGVVTINGDDFGGLVKVAELRSELAKVNAFLNGLRTAILNAPIISGDGGAAFKSFLVNQMQAYQLPSYNAIESTKTKHGSL